MPSLRCKSITYLHLSIIGDAPKVATCLVRHGTDVWEGESDYPDLTPLYLAIARPQNTCAQDLDNALRIACSYSLPRTCRYLLARGADPNSLSRFGLAAIHMAVMKRLPWRNFRLGLGLADRASLIPEKNPVTARWNSMLVETVSILLQFGGDPNLRSSMSRVHSCTQRCYKSLDCSHPGQGVLHFACGDGHSEVVELLLEHGASLEMPDGEGYLPVFPALCQGHESLALHLLRRSADPVNLIIVQRHQSTALHVACRFASPEAVSFLLERGAYADSTDSSGKTPLHEVLSQDFWGLEDDLVETLRHLDRSGATADIRAKDGRTAREMGANSGFLRVREQFKYIIVEGLDQDFEPEYHLRSPPASKARSSRFPDTSHQSTSPTAQREIASHAPPSSRSGPSPSQYGMKHPAMDDSVWFDKARTERLIPRTSPVENPLLSNHRRRLTEGEMRPTAVQDTSGDGIGTKESIQKPQRSESAKFWGSFSFQPQITSDSSVQSPCKERKEDIIDGGPRRGRRKQKWARLDLH